MSQAKLCPKCKQLIGSEETTCSWCGTSKNAPWWRLINMTANSGDGSWVIKAIITLNVLYYIISLMLEKSGGLLSPGRASLLLLGATGTLPIDHYGRVWSLFTANYLHGGILHIIFNLMALRQIGPWTANEFGTSRMFTIYTLGGVSGYIVSYLAGVPFTIGASAAVCSLTGSLMYYGRSRGGAYGSNVFRELSGWVISIFIFGFLFPGINNWAHGGGLAGGALLGMLLGYNERREETAFDHALAILCAAATIGSIALAIASIMKLL